MKRTSLLLLLFICISFYGQDLPNLEFKNTTFTYRVGNNKIEAFSNNSEGNITYNVIAWKSDKDDSEQGENPVVDYWYGPLYVENSGWAIVEATIAAWKNYSERSVTAKITVNKKQITVRVNNAERIYGDSSESYSFVEINPGDISKNDLPLHPAPKYISIEKDEDVNDGIDPKQYPITFLSDPKWNYQITVEPGYLTIKKADLWITHKYPEGTPYYIEDGDTFFYYEKVYGDENPEFAADWEPVEGLKEWDIGKSIVTGNLQIDDGNIFRDTDCDTISLPPDVSEMSSKNYHVKIADGANATLIIHPRPLTLEAGDATVEYGEIDATNNGNSLTYTANWVKGADKDNFEQVPELYINALNTTDVGGPYHGVIIFFSVGAHKNYILDLESTVNGDLTVTKAPLKIYPGSYTTIYKSPLEISNEIYIDRLKNNRDIERFKDVYKLEVVNGNLFKSNAGTSILQYVIGGDVGSYDIIIDPGQLNFNEANYEIEIRKGSYTINQATLTIDVDNINMFVGDTLPQLKRKFYVNHSDPYDPDELQYSLNPKRLRINNFSTNEPATFDVLCDTIYLPNYTHEINTGKLTVFAHAFIDNTTKLEVCRDAGGAMAVNSKSAGKTYEWFIQFPGVDTFQIIDQSIIDTLRLSGLNSNELRLDSVLVRHEDYYFNCKLTSTILVYPDRDSLERSTETVSGPIGIEIKDTPPFARVIVKGGTILICGDPSADSYKWYKSGEDTVLDSTQYLDIYGDDSSAELYYVITSNDNGCSTKSSLLTENGYQAKEQYDAERLVISISPNPVKQGGLLSILATDLTEGKPFDIFIYNQMGELKLEKSGTVVKEELGSLRLYKDKIEPGIYYLHLIHNSMRNSIVLLVSD